MPRAERRSPIEAFLVAARAEFSMGSLSWLALDVVLDEYRLRADVGRPLDDGGQFWTPEGSEDP